MLRPFIAGQQCQEVPLSEDSWLFIPVAYKLLLFYAYYNKQQADLFWDASNPKKYVIIRS